MDNIWSALKKKRGNKILAHKIYKPMLWLDRNILESPYFTGIPAPIGSLRCHTSETRYRSSGGGGGGVIMWRLHFRHNNTAPFGLLLPLPPQRLALGMADGERSPLLSDLGDGALGSGNGGVSPGAAPYGVPNKPPSEYPWCSLLHPTPAGVSLACDALHSLSVRVSLLAQLRQWQRSSQ